MRARWNRETAWRAAVTAAYAGIALSIGLYLLGYPAFVYGGNDLLPHSGFVQDVSFSPLSVPQAHFLLHVLARGVMLGIGQDESDLAIEIVVTAAAALGAWLLTGYMARRSRTWSWGALGALVVLVGETPYVFVELPSEIRRGTGYFVLHLWATPTNAFLLPMTMLLMPRLLVSRRPTSVRSGFALAALVVLSMVGKPNAALVLVPAALIVAAFAPDRWRSSAARLRYLALYAFVPILVVGLVQFRFVSNLDPTYHGGFRFAPLHEMELAGMARPVAWIGLLLPFAFLVVAGGRWWLDRSVQFGLAATAVGMAQFALLGETGYRENHANWGVSAHVGYLVLTIVAVGYLLERFSEAGSDAPGKGPRRTAGALIAAMLLAGVVAWFDSLGVRY